MNVDQFAADLVDFAEENWDRFLAWAAAERDYSEADIEKMSAAIKRKAGRS